MLHVRIGDLGLAFDEHGNERRARVVKVRGGNRFDLAIEGIKPSDSQHVGLQRGPGELFWFLPDGTIALPASEAPTDPLRLYPAPPPAPIPAPPMASWKWMLPLLLSSIAVGSEVARWLWGP